MMSVDTAAQGFAAVGSGPRLEVLRLLVKAGGEGLAVGEIKDVLGIPASTLAHHLRFLASAGLIQQQRRGKSILSYAAFDQIRLLAGYLLEECCADEMTIRKGRR